MICFFFFFPSVAATFLSFYFPPNFPVPPWIFLPLPLRLAVVRWHPRPPPPSTPAASCGVTLSCSLSGRWHTPTQSCSPCSSALWKLTKPENYISVTFFWLLRSFVLPSRGAGRHNWRRHSCKIVSRRLLFWGKHAGSWKWQIMFKNVLQYSQFLPP